MTMHKSVDDGKGSMHEGPSLESASFKTDAKVNAPETTKVTTDYLGNIIFGARSKS